MADIFISYTREDRRIAERLSIALEQLGFDVWWDFELLSGDGYRSVIERVIDECGATVVLWSELSRQSTFVVDEASDSRDLGKLCPARIDDCRLPLGFGGDHVVDLRSWDGEMGHEGLHALLRAIELKTGKKAALGAKPRGENDEARFAEMEAFKAAEAAGNAFALKSFLRDYPRGVFATFVRGQLETTGVATMAYAGGAASPAPRSRPQASKPARRPSAPVAAAATRQTRSHIWIWTAGLIALAAASSIGFVVMPRLTASPAANVAVATIDASYALAALHPQVRAAVEDARRDEALANGAADRARAIAQEAEDNIGAQRNGEDVRVFSGDHAGDRYAGQLANNLYEGAGVYTWGLNAANTFGGQSVAGEFSNDAPHGAGIYSWRDGKRYAGQLANWQREGAGVFTFADGRRYEGQWSGDRQNGYGVEWDAQGRVIQQGVWSDGALATPLAAP